MGSRFVRPETRTLTLANGDTLKVKRRLTHGEQMDAFNYMARAREIDDAGNALAVACVVLDRATAGGKPGAEAGAVVQARAALERAVAAVDRLKAPSRVNRVDVGMGTVLAYLVDWHLAEDHVDIFRRPQDEVAAVLNGLAPESFDEIKAAIEKHEVEMAAEREAAKNPQDGATPSPAISPSPSEWAGVTSGSGT